MKARAVADRQAHSMSSAEHTLESALRDTSRQNVANIHSMLRELKTIAEVERCDLLTHLLEMAYLESGDILRGLRPLRSNKTGSVYIKRA